MCLQLDSSRGLVLDLRDNPGGTVGPGLDIAGTLLPNGAPFVSISGREMNSERIAVSKAGSRPAITKQPMVRTHPQHGKIHQRHGAEAALIAVHTEQPRSGRAFAPAHAHPSCRWC